MQTHGVPQFPDPTSNGAIGLPPGVDPNSPQFQKAFQACQSLLPNNGPASGLSLERHPLRDDGRSCCRRARASRTAPTRADAAG